MVHLARDRFDAGARLCGDERAAVERGAASNQFLDARDRGRSSNELDGAAAGPWCARARVCQLQGISHDFGTREMYRIQLRPVTHRATQTGCRTSASTSSDII